MISTLDVGTISGVEKFIQRAKNSYFMNIFQFQCLLSQNGLLIKVQRSGYRELQSISGQTNYPELRPEAFGRCHGCIPFGRVLSLEVSGQMASRSSSD
jgi:hypothetical protein